MSGSRLDEGVHDDMAASISDAMANLLSRHTGRGATTSWTTFGRDLIVCVMADALTKGEQWLVQSGKGEAVLHIRRAYHESMAEEAIGLVEELSGRRVTAFMSNNHVDPDIAVEIFVLQPSPGGRDARDLAGANDGR
jgi:uncharacterized protein YbcI